MCLSWLDEDDSPGKCILYFILCRATQGVPAEMEAWESEKWGKLRRWGKQKQWRLRLHSRPPDVAKEDQPED